LSFAAQRAADAEFILARENSEFGLAIQFWDSDLDPEADDPTSSTRGQHFAQANDRREDEQGQSELRRVAVQVTKANVEAIDDEGWMSVNGKVYAIESVHDADLITWVIRGSLDEPTKLGNAARLYGG
jgi:hypothetical protein